LASTAIQRLSANKRITEYAPIHSPRKLRQALLSAYSRPFLPHATRRGEERRGKERRETKNEHLPD
jgi:hypothetical protein